jgi:hypothetical protein
MDNNIERPIEDEHEALVSSIEPRILEWEYRVDKLVRENHSNRFGGSEVVFNLDEELQEPLDGCERVLDRDVCTRLTDLLVKGGQGGLNDEEKKRLAHEIAEIEASYFEKQKEFPKK